MEQTKISLANQPDLFSDLVLMIVHEVEKAMPEFKPILDKPDLVQERFNRLMAWIQVKTGASEKDLKDACQFIGNCLAKSSQDSAPAL